MFNIIASILQTGSGNNQVNLPTPSANSSTLHTVLQIVFALAGAIAFLMLVIAAFQYTISRGEPQATARAKDTIIYALVGVVICVLAFSIVSFVYKTI